MKKKKRKKKIKQRKEGRKEKKDRQLVEEAYRRNGEAEVGKKKYSSRSRKNRRSTVSNAAEGSGKISIEPSPWAPENAGDMEVFVALVKAVSVGSTGAETTF